MSVFLAVHLDCNRCTARYVPLRPSVDSAAVRAEADAAGWLCNFRGRGEDYCGVCAETPLGDYQTPRGICPECGTERALTMRATIRRHPVTGGRELCKGGGQPPQRLTRAHAKPLDYDWRTQRGRPGRA